MSAYFRSFGALESQSHRFSETAKAGSMAPVSSFAQIVIEAGALASMGFAICNMKKCLQIMVQFLLHKLV